MVTTFCEGGEGGEGSEAGEVSAAGEVSMAGEAASSAPDVIRNDITVQRNNSVINNKDTVRFGMFFMIRLLGSGPL